MTHVELHLQTQQSWRRFLETYEPLRGELYKYCRYLARSPWDAEDLAQDTLARAFATLAQMSEDPKNPRAWLFRIASNLWIDHVRRRREVPQDELAGGMAAPSSRASREAAGTLLVKLSPQERAAVVLKDVFDLSLEEIAQTLDTTPGAIKSALHRGRDKLVDDKEPATETAPRPAALDAFVTALNVGDLDRLTALLLDTAVVEVVGATTQYGREAARRTVLSGMLFGVKQMVSTDPICGFDQRYFAGVVDHPPRAEARWHRGQWVLLHWYEHVDGPAVRAFSTLALDDAGEAITHVWNYFYNPDMLADLGAELEVPVRSNGRRWWRPS